MPVTATAEASHRSSATARFGATAAYLLNEAYIASCGRASAALRPFLSAATEKHCPCRNSGCTLSRAPFGLRFPQIQQIAASSHPENQNDVKNASVACLDRPLGTIFACCGRDRSTASCRRRHILQS